MTPAAEAETDRYREEIEALIAMFLAGSIAKAAFQRAFIDATDRHHVAMFAIGGGNPNTAESKKVLADAKKITNKQARKLARSIVSAAATLGAAAILKRLSSRLDLWQNTGLGIFNDGVINASDIVGAPEVRLRWDYDPKKEHCSDCQALDGVVLTRSEWRQLGIRPNSHQLECGGWRCGCTLNATEAESDGLEAVKGKLGI